MNVSTRFLERAVSALLVFWIVGCARGPLKSPEQAMRPAREAPSLTDDLDFASLVAGLEANVSFLRANPQAMPEFRFGPRVLKREDYLWSLEHLLKEAKADATGEKFRRVLRENFEAHEVYGQGDWGEVLITSYFEPLLEGSLKPTPKHSQPLYGLPKDMVTIDVDSFVAIRPALATLKASEQRSEARLLRGRVIAPAKPFEPPRITPYLDRSQIALDNLKDRAPILAWVDPIDAFFLEIQGSGVVNFDNGKSMKVGYAAQNGHPYVPIGKHLLDVISKDKMSLQTIEAHLRSVPADQARKLMNLNPSHVFFRELPNAGVTFLGTEVVAGRTIATDHALFPKGTLAFLEYSRPFFDSSKATEPKEWRKASRFVIDQDTGGAIRGPHRVDLFWGRGSEAKQAAGVMKKSGRLYYFVPKAEFVARRMGS